MKKGNITTIVFYQSFMESALKAGLDKTERCDFYEGMMNYVFKSKEPQFSNSISNGLFTICKENIDATLRKNRRRATAIANGQKGGAPKGNKNAKKAGYKDSQQPLQKPTNKDLKPPTGNNPKTTQETTHSNNTITTTDTITNTQTKTNTSTLLQEERKEEETVENRKKTLNERNKQFYNSLQPYVEENGVEAIQDFYEFWCEPDQDYKHMKFELERTWNLDRRIDVWMRIRKDIKRYHP